MSRELVEALEKIYDGTKVMGSLTRTEMQMIAREALAAQQERECNRCKTETQAMTGDAREPVEFLAAQLRAYAQGSRSPRDAHKLYSAADWMIRLLAENAALRETNTRLNRRCQEAERALPDYAKLIAMPPDGDGVRFVSGNLGRALLASLASRQQEEIAALVKRAEAAERDAAQWRFLRRQYASGRLTYFAESCGNTEAAIDADLYGAREQEKQT